MQAIKAGDNEEINEYYLIEIIKYFQESPEVREDSLFKIELAYLSIFDRNAGSISPKILNKYLSQKPDWFIEAIQIYYQPEKVDQKAPKEIKKNIQIIAEKLYIFFKVWRRPPGEMDDGTFSKEALKKWYDVVKKKTTLSGHLEVAMNYLGKVLFYAKPDSSGLWIQESIAKLIDERDNKEMREGFKNEIYNSRGVHTVSSEESKKLGNYWKKRAEEVGKLGFIRFETTLKSIANDYFHESELIAENKY